MSGTECLLLRLDRTCPARGSIAAYDPKLKPTDRHGSLRAKWEPFRKPLLASFLTDDADTSSTTSLQNWNTAVLPFLAGGWVAYVIRDDFCSLFLERPTPCAWGYPNNAGEVSREMTLIAEAALRGHIGEREPVIAQLFLG
jgi:hypothetical protein